MLGFDVYRTLFVIMAQFFSLFRIFCIGMELLIDKKRRCTQAQVFVESSRIEAIRCISSMNCMQIQDILRSQSFSSILRSGCDDESCEIQNVK